MTTKDNAADASKVNAATENKTLRDALAQPWTLEGAASHARKRDDEREARAGTESLVQEALPRDETPEERAARLNPVDTTTPQVQALVASLASGEGALYKQAARTLQDLLVQRRHLLMQRDNAEGALDRVRTERDAARADRTVAVQGLVTATKDCEALAQEAQAAVDMRNAAQRELAASRERWGKERDAEKEKRDALTDQFRALVKALPASVLCASDVQRVLKDADRRIPRAQSGETGENAGAYRYRGTVADFVRSQACDQTARDQIAVFSATTVDAVAELFDRVRDLEKGVKRKAEKGR